MYFGNSTSSSVTSASVAVVSVSVISVAAVSVAAVSVVAVSVVAVSVSSEAFTKPSIRATIKSCSSSVGNVANVKVLVLLNFPVESCFVSISTAKTSNAF